MNATSASPSIIVTNSNLTEARRGVPNVTYLPHDPEQWLRQVRFNTALSLAHGAGPLTHLSSPAIGQAINIRGRILLAEDNPLVQSVTKGILESDGHIVTVASNGLIALELLRDQRFDLAVVDYHMPVMDGMDLIKAYRNLEVGTRLPIIMLTASASKETAANSLTNGATRFIMKPFNTEALLSIVLSLLPTASVTAPLAAPITQGVSAGFDPSALNALLKMETPPDAVLNVISEYQRNAAALLQQLEAPNARNALALKKVLHSLAGLSGCVGGVNLATYCAYPDNLDESSSNRDKIIDKVRHLSIEVNRHLDDYAASLRKNTSV